MAIGAFPAAKLGVLAIKQISKPIANVIKIKAKDSPVFRKYICMPPAQLYNWVEVKTKMWALNLGKPVNVPPLNEAMAIELGASLLGEFIIFTIGAGLLIFEYARQANNENKKQEALRQEKAALAATLAEMGFRLERQDTQLRELTRVLADVESHSIFRWHKERISEYQQFDPDKPDQSSVNEKPLKEHYNRENGMLHRALNFLETQIFVDGRESEKKKTLNLNAKEEREAQVVIENELAQLKYAVKANTPTAPSAPSAKAPLPTSSPTQSSSSSVPVKVPR